MRRGRKDNISGPCRCWRPGRGSDLAKSNMFGATVVPKLGPSRGEAWWFQTCLISQTCSISCSLAPCPCEQEGEMKPCLVRRAGVAPRFLKTRGLRREAGSGSPHGFQKGPRPRRGSGTRASAPNTGQPGGAKPPEPKRRPHLRFRGKTAP